MKGLTDRMQMLVGIAVFAVLSVSASAAYVQIQQPSPNTCMQANSTFIACMDGAPIKLAFSITAPVAPSFGSFDVTQVDYANVTEPLDIFGNQCVVGSGATATCFVTLNPIPLSMGNGTLTKTIWFQLRSIPYPQLVFNRSVNITIYHYLSHNESIFLQSYNSAYNAYARENSTYAYFCSAYGICSAGIAYGISVEGAYLSLALDNANSGMIQQALYNVSVANRTLVGGLAQYASFVNASNRIVNNVIRTNSLLANISSSYPSYKAMLNNCTTGNTTYLKNIETQVSNAESYPMQTTLNGSIKYLQITNNISAYVSQAIAHCSGRKSILSPFGNLFQRNTYLVILGFVVAIMVIYAILRYRSHMEVKRIRESVTEEERKEEVEKKDEEKRHGGQPEAEAGADDKSP